MPRPVLLAFVLLLALDAVVHGGPGNDTLRADGTSELDGGEGAGVM